MHSPRALDLRQAGLTLQEIADCLGLSRLDVFRALEQGGMIVSCATGRFNRAGRPQ